MCRVAQAEDNPRPRRSELGHQQLEIIAKRFESWEVERNCGRGWAGVSLYGRDEKVGIAEKVFLG